jgi:hypothetical protein
MPDNIDVETESGETDKNGRLPDGRFGAGNCANPNGRPCKGDAVAEIMRAYLDGTIETDNGKITRKEAYVRAMYASAMKGNTAAQRMIWDHIDGMPKQKVETENKNTVIVYTDDDKKVL